MLTTEDGQLVSKVLFLILKLLVENLLSAKSNILKLFLGYLSLPQRSGKIRDISKCDYEFFNMTEHEANYTDVQMRILMETTYEAIVDAGK